MILIFNRPGLIFVVFGAIGAWIASFVRWALGLDGGPIPWSFLLFCAITGGFDIACRYFDVFRTGRSWQRVVSPLAGGQLFFIPVWILIVALLVLVSVS